MFRVIFSGNLGADPEARYSQKGTKILSMRVAVNTRRRDGDEWVDHTDWIRVRLSGPRADTLEQHLRKGSKVLVDGRFEIGEYENRDGERKTSLDCWADDIEFASPREGSNGEYQERPRQEQAQSQQQQPAASRAPARSGPPPQESDLEDLPF